MTSAIYKSTLGMFIRQTEALARIMDEATGFFAENNIDPDSFAGESLCEDMLPFSFQINSVRHHSANAIEGLRTGGFTVPTPLEKTDYASLQTHIAETARLLNAVTEQEFEALLENDVIFSLGEMKVPFTGLGFITSFSVPNFFFHVTTAYNLLRQKGMPIGKRNYLGAMDVKAG